MERKKKDKYPPNIGAVRVVNNKGDGAKGKKVGGEQGVRNRVGLHKKNAKENPHPTRLKLPQKNHSGFLKEGNHLEKLPKKKGTLNSEKKRDNPAVP